MANFRTAGRNSESDLCRFEFLEMVLWDDSISSCESGGKGALDEGMLEEEEEEESSNGRSVEDSKRFWETQHQLLHDTLSRSSSVETRIRNATKEALKEIQATGTICTCERGRPPVTGCRSCLMREVSGHLQNSGYDSAICKSKWKSSSNIPSGEHTFLDVVDNSNTKKKEPVRVIIEINFRAEFEIARASEDYDRLVQELPETFVGKAQKLNTLIKVLCCAAKRCMKEKKMHLGPWRKHKYMRAKWLGACERTMSMPLLSTPYASPRSPNKPKASMLTVDLLEKLPNMHCKVVTVV